MAVVVGVVLVSIVRSQGVPRGAASFAGGGGGSAMARGGDARGAAAAATPAPGSASGGASSSVIVDVAGAVRRPGVYELPARARVQDALRAAGGAAHGAQLASVNRAALVVDGQQIVVARTGGGDGAGVGVAVAPGGDSAVSATGATPTTPVSLNSATVEQLDTLPGVGPATAARIVADRSANGPFRSARDLDRVPGIGPATLARLAPLVTT